MQNPACYAWLKTSFAVSVTVAELLDHVDVTPYLRTIPVYHLPAVVWVVCAVAAEC